MVQRRTILDVVDNSGVKQIRCIEVLGRARRGIGYQGDIIVASVVSLGKKKSFSKINDKSGATSNIAWKRGDLVRALVVRTKKNNHQTQGVKFKTGLIISFPKENSAVLLASGQSKQPKEPQASRILGALPSNLRSKGFKKVLSLGGQTL